MYYLYYSMFYVLSFSLLTVHCCGLALSMVAQMSDRRCVNWTEAAIFLLPLLEDLLI